MESESSFIPSQESEPIEHIHDMFHLSPEQFQALKDRIAKWNGLIRVFVHPMFEKWRGHESKYKDDPESSKLYDLTKMMAKFASMDVDDTPPIIIFEEYKYINAFKDWCNKKMTAEFGGTLQNEFFLVETMYSSADPHGNGSRSENWESVRQLLSSLDVKKILVGGSQLRVSTSKTDVIYNNCVGTTFVELSNEAKGSFDVEFSAITYPESRQDVHKAKRELAENLQKKN